MAFGIDAGISRNQQGTAQVAEKIGPTGVITDMTTHGAVVEKQEEVYADSFVNEATNGQSGTSVITASGYNESNTDYARGTKTTRIAQGT
jgi:hypothetical protein